MTTTLTQSIANRQGTAADKRVEALTLYSELLARRASPHDDDLAALSELQIRLGKSDDDVKVDIGIFDQAARFQQDIDALAVLREEFVTACKKSTAYRKASEAIRQERELENNRLYGDSNALELRINRLQREQPINALRHLRADNSDLFADEASESNG